MAAAYRHEELQKTPHGYRVRSVKRGGHVVRIAFPPGPRRKGAGKVVEILHPKGERNASRCHPHNKFQCPLSEKARTNPGELLIYGNPGFYDPPPEKMGGHAGWLAEMVKRMGSDYRSYRAQGLSHKDAVEKTVSHTTAGKSAIAEFRKSVGNPTHMQVFFDPAIKKFTAAVYDPKFGNLYSGSGTAIASHSSIASDSNAPAKP
jgi:hypothetical protein